MWTDPKASAIALGVLHLFFAYLSVTSNTTFNLGNIFVDHYASNFIFYRIIHINGYAHFPTKHFDSFIVLWTVIAGFLYITWTQRIWPEIRVDAAKPTFKVEYNNPEVLSASELQDIIIIIR